MNLESSLIEESSKVPRSVRKDPFYKLNITDGVLKQGVYNLMARGQLKANSNLKTILDRDRPLLLSKKIEVSVDDLLGLKDPS